MEKEVSWVVLAQHGTWQSAATGGVASEVDVASRFRVNHQQVIEFERYADLTSALTATDLSVADEQ